MIQKKRMKRKNLLVEYILRHKFKILFIVLAVLFFGFKFQSLTLGPRASDESLYFYASYILNSNTLPYRDFSIANLPTQIVFYKLIISVIGFRLAVFKFLVIAVTIGTGYILYSLDKSKVGKEMGLMAAAFFFSSFVLLATTDFATGVHEATFFLVLAWFFLNRSAKLAGFSFFIAILFRRYILPAGIGFVVFGLVKKKFREVALFIAYSIVPYLIINAVLYLIFGDNFIEDAWLYHFNKIKTQYRFPIYSDFMRNSIFSLLFAIASMFIVLKETYYKFRKKKYKSKIAEKYLEIGLGATIVVVMQYIFFGFFSNVFMIYLTTVIPFLSVLSAMALTVLTPKRSRKISWLLISTLVLLNGVLYFKYLRNQFLINSFDDIVSDVKKITKPEDKIFGAYVVTPIVAIASGREITENVADINYQRFLAGMISEEEATKLATKSAVFLQFAAIDDKNRLMGLNPYFVNQEVIFQNCKIFNRYPSEWVGHNWLFMWKCGEN